MTDFVVDASVALKWLIEEPDSSSALKLLGFRLSAPDLLIPECGNALWRKSRKGELSEAEALFGAGLLQRMDIELHPMRQLLEAATRIALRADHAVYDCMYLALAEVLACAFITEDRRLVAKARNLGLSAEIWTLRDVDARL